MTPWGAKYPETSINTGTPYREVPRKSPTCAGMTFKVTASELNMGDDRFKHITGGLAGTLDGRRVGSMQRGVNIIRANGSVRKVSVK